MIKSPMKIDRNISGLAPDMLVGTFDWNAEANKVVICMNEGSVVYCIAVLASLLSQYS